MMTEQDKIDFVKSSHNLLHLNEARLQQRQLHYFTKSSIQKEITSEYLTQWVERKYAGTDYFLTFVKMIFREENFLSFFKYLRHPLPSARLINDDVLPQLRRVFTSEDAYFRYTVRKKEVKTPEELKADQFTQDIFNAFIYRHNDIVFVDLKEINKAYRYIVCIDDVVAIDCEDDGTIGKIAFKAEVEREDGSEVYGFLYADDKEYIFYDREYRIIIQEPHDLGVCPADFISQEALDHNPIIRKSIFSYIREELEEYVFLKTLLKMTEPNGAIPVVTKLSTKEIDVQGKDKRGASDKEPMASNGIGGQQSRVTSEVTGSKSILQTGTIIDVPAVKNANGEINMDVVNNFIKFFYIPVDSLNYVNSRIKEIKASIITAILGDYQEANQAAVNELQISRSYINRQDKLRYLSHTLSAVRNSSDYKMLALEYGKDAVSVDVFFGSDFFIETQADLYDLFAKSPNPIESRNLLIRMSQNRNRYNKTRADRDKILYGLLPYANDKDFQTAIAQLTVDPVTSTYQTRFNYWVNLFEASYGDIVSFWDSMEDAKESEKIITINGLIKQIINENSNSSTTAGV